MRIRAAERHNKSPCLRRSDLKTLHCGKNSQRRGNHAVAIEQRRAENACQDDGVPFAPGKTVLSVRDRQHKGHEGEDATFPLVVCPHDQDYVLKGHHCG